MQQDCLKYSSQGKRENGLKGLVHLLRVILTVVIRYSLIWMYRICSPVTVYTYRWQWRLNLTHLWAPHAERRSIINSVFAFCSSTHCPLSTDTFQTYTETEKASKRIMTFIFNKLPRQFLQNKNSDKIRFHFLLPFLKPSRRNAPCEDLYTIRS